MDLMFLLMSYGPVNPMGSCPVWSVYPNHFNQGKGENDQNMGLKELESLVDFFVISVKGDYFCGIQFALLNAKSLLK